MPLVIQVLHHSLRESVQEQNYSMGWNHVLATELARRNGGLRIESWGPDKFVSREVSWEEPAGVVNRLFPSVHTRYGIEVSGTMLARLSKVTREERTVVHLHGAYNLNSYVIARLFGGRVPLLTQFHDPSDDGRVWSKVRDRLREWALSPVRRCLVPSEGMRRALPKRLRAKTTVLPFGVDLETFHRWNKAVARRSLHLDQSAKYGLYVGRLIPAKGVALLLGSVPQILSRQSDFHLIIAGNGPMTRTLMDQASSLGVAERITLLGRVEESLLPALYSAADVLIHPSLRDAGPMVVLEALACGTSVVATRQGYVPELSQKVGGINLISDPSPASIAEAVVSAFGSGDQGTENRRRALDDYGWDSVVKRILGLYREMLR